MIAPKRALKVNFDTEIIILVGWSILITKNDYIFKGIIPSLYACRTTFKKDFLLLTHRTKKRSTPILRIGLNLLEDSCLAVFSTANYMSIHFCSFLIFLHTTPLYHSLGF